MAKKEKLKLDPFELDSDLDFEIYSGGFDFDSDALDSKDDRNPVTKVIRGAGSGFVSTIKEPAFVQKVARDSLPNTYGEVSSGIAEASKGIKKLYEESINEIKPQIQVLADKIDQIIPDEAKTIKKVTTSLKKALGSDGGGGDKGPSAEQIREQSITNDLSQVFGASLEYQQAIDKKREATDKIKEAIDDKRFNDSFGVISSIDENVSRLTQYNERVNQAYQKKSLELQFRSYYTQKELLETTKKYFEVFKTQNEAITKNTGLPDSVKFQGIERLTNVSANKLWDSIHNRVVGDGSYIRKGFERIHKRAKEKIEELKSSLGSANEMLDGIITAREMGSTVGMDSYETLGVSAGSYGATTLADKAAPYIKKKLDRVPKVQETLASLAEAVVDTPGVIRRYQDSEAVQDAISEGGIKGKAAELFGDFLSFFTEEGEDYKLSRKGGLNELGKPNLAGFDNRSHITLNEVIPGYLARIHQELRASRTGQYPEIISFDYTRNKFMDRSELKSNLKDYIFSGFKESSSGSSTDRYGKTTHYNLREAVERFANEVQGGVRLTDQQRQEIKDFVFKLSQKKNVDLTPENIKRTRDFDELSEPMKGLVAGWLDNFSSNTRRRHQYDIKKRIQEVKSATPDARAHIDRLVNAGYGEVLEEEGIISYNPDGSVVINEAKYKSFVREFAMMDDESYNSIYGKDTAADARKKAEKKGPTILSDLDAKTNVRPFNPKSALNAIKNTKVYNWVYKGYEHAKGRITGQTYTGPMAQDVQRHLGNDVAPNGEKIDIVSMNGANMAAIQQLSKEQDNIKERLRKDRKLDYTALLEEISHNTAETNRLLSSGSIIGTLLGGNGSASDGRSFLNRTIAELLSGAGRRLSKASSIGKRGLSSIFNRGKNAVRSAKDAVSNIYQNNKEAINSRLLRVIDGTIDLAGSLVTGAKDLVFNTLPNSIRNVSNFALDKIKGGKELLNKWLSQARDIYIPGEKFPRLRAHLMSIGHYIDQATGKVITNLEDLKSVKGNIVDKAGNVVMTLEELANGIRDANGNDIREIATSVGQYLASAAYKTFIGTKDRLSAAFSIIKDKTIGLGSRVKDSAKALLGNVGMGGDRIYNVLVQIRDLIARQFMDEEGVASLSAIKAASSSTQDNSRDTPDLPRSEDARYTSGGLLSSLGGKLGSMASSASDFLGSLGDRLTDRSTRRGRGKLGAAVGLASGLLGKAVSGASKGLGAITSMFGGGSTPSDTEGQESSPMSFIKSLFSKAKDKVRDTKEAIIPAGKRAFNDLDGSGLRDGAWQERIEEWKDKQKQAQEERKLKAEELAGRNKARYTDHSKSLINKLLEHSNALFKSLGGAVDWVKDKAGGLFGDILDEATDLPDGPDRKGERNPRGRTPRGPKGKGGFFRNLLQRGKNLAIRGALAAKPLLVAGGAKAAAGLGLAKTFLATKAAATTAAIATATSGMTLGGMAASAGAAIAGFLSSPVVLAGAAITAVGAGAYFGYKYFTKNNLDELQRFRIIQYGFSGEEESEDVYSKVLALEEFLFSKVKINEDRNGNFSSSISISKEDVSEILDEFDIDEGKPEQVDRFIKWLHSRFRPIYIQHLRALTSVRPGKKLSELSDLSMQDQYTYFSRIRIDLIENNYMKMMYSPFEGITIIPDNIELSRRYRKQVLLSYFKDGQFDKKAGSNLDSRSGKNVVWSQATLDSIQANSDREKISGLERAKLAEQLHKEEDRKSFKDKVLSIYKKTYDSIFSRNKPSDVEQDPGSQSLGMPMHTQDQERPSGNDDYSKVTTGNLKMADGPKKSGDGAHKYIKLAKGAKLQGLNPEMLKNFLGMVEEYGESTGKKVQVNTAFRSYEEQAALHRQNPRKAARPGRSLHEFGLAIDMNTVDINSLEKAGLMRKYGFTRPVGGETWHIEPAGIQVDVQKAKNDPVFATQAIIGSIGRGGGGYGSSKGTQLGRRNKELALKLLNAPATIVKSEDNEEKGSIPEPNLATNTTSATPNRGTGRPSDLASMVSFNPPIGASANQDNFEGGYSGGYQTPIVQGQTYEGPSIPQKSPDFESKPTEDTGSATSSSEESTSGKGLLGTIAKFAQQVGIPAKLLQTLAIIESDLRPHAKASTSSAAGLFQFIRSTWQEVISRYGSKYGISPGTPPTDVKASTLMAGEYIKQNLRAITPFKPNPNPVDVYLTHFLGPGGARTFLRADPNEIGAKVLPKAANANKGIFYDKGGRPRTIAQIYELLKNRINNKTKRYGIDVSSGTSLSSNADNQNVTPETSTSSGDVSVGSTVRESPVKNTIDDFVSSGIPSVDRGSGVDSSYSSNFNPFAPPPNQFIPSSNVSDHGANNFRGMEDKLTESVSIQSKMLDVLMEIRDKIAPNGVSTQPQQAGVAKEGPPAPLAKSARSNSPSAIDVKRRVA